MVRRTRVRTSPGPGGSSVETGQSEADRPPGLNPGVLITFDPASMKEAVSRLKDAAGAQTVAYAAEFADHAVDAEQARSAGMLVFDTLGVAVMDVDPDQASSMAALSIDGSGIAAVEQEPIFFAFGNASPDFYAYLTGYKDAVDHLYGKLMAGGPAMTTENMVTTQSFQDTNEATWGLLATGVTSSRSSGRGIRVAVLDTGMDLDHPDFRGRQILGQTFIAGQPVDDDNGHGTHCIGTACGTRNPSRGRRYGIAYEAEIYAGKVLSNQGSSLGRSTLMGMEWAVKSKCHIVSMSLGSLVMPGQGHLTAFENIARLALRNDTLIIAAAGNESRRSQGKVMPVGSPANCPSIMAVAAVDRSMRTADFSNGSINPDGRVDIAGPGVDVYSSAPEPGATPQPPRFSQWPPQYHTISGTSMATPHVAGIAALLRQENPSLSANEIWRLLASRAHALTQPSGDVGAGLAQA